MLSRNKLVVKEVSSAENERLSACWAVGLNVAVLAAATPMRCCCWATA